MKGTKVDGHIFDIMSSSRTVLVVIKYYEAFRVMFNK